MWNKVRRYYSMCLAQPGETTGKKTGTARSFVANTVCEFASILFMLINQS